MSAKKEDEKRLSEATAAESSTSQLNAAVDDLDIAKEKIPDKPAAGKKRRISEVEGRSNLKQLTMDYFMKKPKVLPKPADEPSESNPPPDKSKSTSNSTSDSVSSVKVAEASDASVSNAKASDTDKQEDAKRASGKLVIETEVDEAVSKNNTKKEKSSKGDAPKEKRQSEPKQTKLPPWRIESSEAKSVDVQPAEASKLSDKSKKETEKDNETKNDTTTKKSRGRSKGRCASKESSGRGAPMTAKPRKSVCIADASFTNEDSKTAPKANALAPTTSKRGRSSTSKRGEMGPPQSILKTDGRRNSTGAVPQVSGTGASRTNRSHSRRKSNMGPPESAGFITTGRNRRVSLRPSPKDEGVDPIPLSLENSERRGRASTSPSPRVSTRRSPSSRSAPSP